MYYAEEIKFTANACLFISYNFVAQTPRIQAVLSSFFHNSNNIARGSNRGGLNIGVINGV